MHHSHTAAADVRRARRCCGKNRLRTVAIGKIASRRSSRRKLDAYVRKFNGDWEDFDLPEPSPFTAWDVF